MSQAKAPRYTLRYFEFSGLAGTIRLLLDFVGAKWTEEHPEWPAKKSEQPFGHLPVLIEKSSDDQAIFTLSESLVIERYLLRKFNLLPSDPELAARQEQLRDQLYDCQIAIAYAKHAEGESGELIVNRCKEMLDSLCLTHAKALRANGGNGHFFGDKITYPDLALYAFMKHICEELAMDGSNELIMQLELEKVPEFAKVVNAVRAELNLPENLLSKVAAE